MFMPLAMALNGWYIATLWLWLIVPAFHVPPLSVPVCIGVALVAHAIHPTPRGESQNKDRSAEQQLFFAVVEALLRVGLGLLVALVVRGFIGGAQ